MRCPDCNKFAAYDTDTEPEVNLNDPEDPGKDDIDEHGRQEIQITGDCRIVLTHDECGTELKETTFDVDTTVKFDHRLSSMEHKLSLEVQNSEITDESKRKVKRKKSEGGGYKLVPGGGRYSTTFYGAQVTFQISCSCGEEKEYDWSDETAASAMDELT